MTNRFLISVAAAALIAGTGFANAQGMSREGGGAAGGAGCSRAAPSSERAAPSGAEYGSGSYEGCAIHRHEGLGFRHEGANRTKRWRRSKSAQDSNDRARSRRA